ncbi:MAG TPA: hypothetical protein VGD46_25005 [Rhizobacter sp.]
MAEKRKDEHFPGDAAQLVACINALLDLDKAGLVEHGIPTMIRQLLNGARTFLGEAVEQATQAKMRAVLGPAAAMVGQRVDRVERGPLAHMGTLELLNTVRTRLMMRTATAQEADIIGALAVQVRAPGTIVGEDCGDCPNEEFGGCQPRCAKVPPLGPDQTPRETAKWQAGYHAGADAVRSELVTVRAENEQLRAQVAELQERNQNQTITIKTLRETLRG